MPLRAAAIILALLAWLPAAEHARADVPRELKWAEMMPPAKPRPKKPKTFFSGATPSSEFEDDTGPPPPPKHYSEGEWMSLKRRQPGADLPPRIVEDLNGQRVKIGGYVVPLDFEATTVKEFLLVPFVGACIHVPPPPANQIIYVKAETGFELGKMFDPVTVTGTMKTEPAFTGLADAGYSIDAETVEPGAE
jgi:uncharacterized protein